MKNGNFNKTNELEAKIVNRSTSIIKAWIMLILAVIYVASPIDLIPDFIPVAGWADDVTLLVTAITNLIKAYKNKSLS